MATPQDNVSKFNNSFVNLSQHEHISGVTKSVTSTIGFSVIASMAFLSNSLLCVMLLTHRQIMKKASCHMFILSLAVSDMMTGVGLLVTPSFILSKEYLHPSSGIFGYLFCTLLSTQYLIFTFGIVSVYTITIIAIERWHAVVIPVRYKTRFSSKRCRIYIAVIWVTSCIMNCSTLFDLTVSKDDPYTKCIKRDSTIGDMKVVVAVGEFLAKFVIPLTICFASLIHLYVRVRQSALMMEGRRVRTTIKLLRMCVVTAVALALCWIPNQVLYLLFKFDQADLGTPLHNFTVILAMSNSCINPWLYCATNSTYRTIFKNAFCCLFHGNRVVQDTDTHPKSGVFLHVRNERVTGKDDPGYDRWHGNNNRSPDVQLRCFEIKSQSDINRNRTNSK